MLLALEERSDERLRIHTALLLALLGLGDEAGCLEQVIRGDAKITCDHTLQLLRR